MDDHDSIDALQVQQSQILLQMANALEADDTGIFVKLRDQFEHLNWRIELKELGDAPGYIWHTEQDDKVRDSHHFNDGKTFQWDLPPATGHPGEDYNCRCWAEPVDGKAYARQKLITPINDNPRKLTTFDLMKRYHKGDGSPITMEEIGRMADFIDYYSYKVTSRADGQPGIYRRVEQQVIDTAIKNGEGYFTYGFEDNYDFLSFLVALGDTTIKGEFAGQARKEILGDQKFLVITGVVTYDHEDEFTDIFSQVERAVEEDGLSREEAEEQFNEQNNGTAKPFDITTHWQTKFNATVAVGKMPKR